ncbi:NAD(P)H-binding protein [Amycolatopsis nalaikhensis]|uniref:NAD(P)H-binding protein n=1 Tax=Amycolatopsis nalaikhensis TaxID=715472 RepID=A0ABY8Y1I1_9PSEU|nr:NAD(P)H-binding protein [Amycolatopsis sp. 2-2]WIV61482.1 NAD(P)H-binding protein [Amycolatopsis sp. 2-2]
MTVWVEGATGKAGRRVVDALTAAGVPVRAASRHPGPAHGPVTPVRFDWTDETTWAPALGDAEALFVKGLDSDVDAAKVIARLIASAPSARRVVLMSAAGVDRAPDHAPRRAVELAVRDSGLPWTVLRPNWFLQNFGEDEWVFARALRETGELYAGSGDSRVSFTDTRDLADAAVTVLTENGHDGRGYTITGPEAVTFGEVARVLAEASGRPIRHRDATPAEHQAHFAKSGRPDAWVEHMLELFELVRAGVSAPVSDDFRRLTGKAPRTLAAYAEERWRS